MEFKKYPKMIHDDDEIVDELKAGDLHKGEWIVTEKVHGANFSFHLDGEELMVCNRTQIMQGDEKFFNFQKVVSENEGKIRSLYEKAQDGWVFKKLTVYGELFGGCYNHPEVPHHKGAQKLQKGVYYSPENLFYAFDIAMDDRIVNNDAFERFCDEVELFRTEVLFRGTFEEALDYTDTFQTTIPERLGLPRIEDNLCEGIVIKPEIPIFLNNGKRLCFKKKNGIWKERANKQKKKTPKQEVEYSPECLDLEAEILTFVTENRLLNVISKLGKITTKDLGKFIKAMNEDINEEFFAKYGDRYKLLGSKEQKKVSRSANQASVNMIKQHLKDN